MTELRVSEDFSPYLGGRYRDDGPWSGEQFREDVLLPKLSRALERGERLVVILDGVAGVPSSFLEEAFGGMFRRRRDWSYAVVERALEIRSNDPDLLPYVRLAYEHMKRQASRQ